MVGDNCTIDDRKIHDVNPFRNGLDGYMQDGSTLPALPTALGISLREAAKNTKGRRFSWVIG